jgi:hypothetical protein
VRRLAFLADRLESSSQTVFTLELLDKFAMPPGRLRSLKLTMRSSLICGLAGGLVLGASSLTAYGWRGGLAGAAIGMAMGLPHSERIDTSDVSYNRRKVEFQSTVQRLQSNSVKCYSQEYFTLSRCRILNHLTTSIAGPPPVEYSRTFVRH